MTSDDRLRGALLRLVVDRNDEAGWRDLFAVAWPFMVTVCARLRGNADDAQDAAQKAMIAISKYAPLEDLQDPGAFRAYARVVCRRIVIADSRKEVRAGMVSLDSLELASDDLDPSQQADTRTLQELVMTDLDERDRTLVQMTIDGFRLKEIAERLGISESNAGVRILRIRRRLRKWLR